MTRLLPSLAVLGALWGAPAAGQLVEPNQVGLRMGHIHLVVRDVDAHRHFWTTYLGGTVVRNGPLELIEFPGVYIMLRKGESTGSPAHRADRGAVAGMMRRPHARSGGRGRDGVQAAAGPAEEAGR